VKLLIIFPRIKILFFSSNGCSSTQGPSDASSQEDGGVNSNDVVDFAEQSTSQHENAFISPARLLKRPVDIFLKELFELCFRWHSLEQPALFPIGK